MKNIISTIKSWNVENFNKLKGKDKENCWELIDQKEGLNYKKVKQIDPQYIFFPHWSWRIPEEIWKNYECVVFHETDLPFGRGGSPIQNLIERGIYNTKISAIKVNEKMDAGDIYLKKDLDISKGNVEEILRNSSKIIFEEMIPEIIRGVNLLPQEGEITYFKRRTPEQSNIIKFLKKLSYLNPAEYSKKLYDFVRMNDGEGYPKAYIPLRDAKIEFFNASSNKINFRFETKSKNE
jgi:methionyl-tRNA formyltransferase